MQTPEGANDICMSFNIFNMAKILYIRFLHIQNVSVWWSGKQHSCCHSNIMCTNSMFLLLVYWQLSDVGMASTRSTVRKVTVVTSTSRHSTRRPHRDHCHPGQPYPHNTLLVGQYGARIATYSSVVKLLFTLRASARTVAPESLIPFCARLWKSVLQN